MPHLAAWLSTLLIAVLAVNSGQALVLCTGAGGYGAVEFAHPGARHIHAPSSSGDVEVGGTTTALAFPAHGCEDVPLGTDLALSVGQDREVAVALALLTGHTPTPPDRAALRLSRIHVDAEWRVPSPQRQALQTVVLLI